MRGLLVALVAFAPSACLLDWDALRDDGTTTTTDGGGSDVKNGTDAPHEASGEGGVEAGKDAASCGDTTLVINEVQTGGSGGPTDEFVEFFNPSACDVALEGWSLRYSSSTGSTPFPAWTGAPGDKVPAAGYAVLGGPGFQGAVLAHFGNTGGTLSSTGGGIGIADRTGTVIDSMAYGTISAGHPFVRPSNGSAAPAPGVGQSVGRSPNGKNTNVNATDFVIQASPSPGAKNS